MPERDAREGRPEIRSEVRELSLLLEISRILDRSVDLRDTMDPVLKSIAAHLGMERCTITILDRDTGDIFIEEAHGLTTRQLRAGRYRFGEGVIGTVVIYLSIKEEDKLLVKKFGDDYVKYMQTVPGMNIFLGIIRVTRKKSAHQNRRQIYVNAKSKKNAGVKGDLCQHQKK